MGRVEPLRWIDPPDGPAVAILDQTRLPAEEVTLVCRDVSSLVAAIKSLAVRGAPLLGIAGGYGVALAAAVGADVPAAAAELANARPTAVNLARATHRVLAAYTDTLARPDAGMGRPDAAAGRTEAAAGRTEADIGRPEPDTYRPDADIPDPSAGAGRTDVSRRGDNPLPPGGRPQFHCPIRVAGGGRPGRGPVDNSGRSRAAARALAEAHAIAAEEAEASARMGEHGLTLVPGGARILTHCNTGALAAGGEGTALAVVVAAHRAGRLRHLWVDETRPLLQGARLTAYEARRHGIPYAVLPDNAAGSLFAAGEVDLVVVGADRIARDGSVANKIGTYPLAVLAHRHGVPFVVVAPTSTIDMNASTGADIPIERRDASEVTTIAGKAVAPEGSPAYNPAFDVTPGDLVTAIVTERGVITRANGGNLGLLGGPQS